MSDLPTEAIFASIFQELCGLWCNGVQSAFLADLVESEGVAKALDCLGGQYSTASPPTVKACPERSRRAVFPAQPHRVAGFSAC